jgi:hypothetical protein
VFADTDSSNTSAHEDDLPGQPPWDEQGGPDGLSANEINEEFDREHARDHDIEVIDSSKHAFLRACFITEVYLQIKLVWMSQI